MAAVLITGGGGFIGSHTAAALVAAGHRVRVLDILDPQIHGEGRAIPADQPPEVEFLRGDVRNAADVAHALEGIDAVYHFAALTGVGQSMYDIRSYVDTNCVGTATLLEALIKRRQQLKRFVLASSRAVYGEGTYACQRHGIVYPLGRRRTDLEAGNFAVTCADCGQPVRPLPTREDRPLFPFSMYAWNKKQQEEYCQYAARTFALPVTVLRYFNVYGSRQSLRNPYTGIVSVFYGRIRAGQPISLYEHGDPRRDFVHVSDVVRANLLALDADIEPGACINIGSGTDATVRDVAQTLGRACGAPVQLLDRGEFRVGDIYACYADLERARTLLAYAPVMRLEEGMREFVTWAATQETMDLYERAVADLGRHGLFGSASAPDKR